MTTIKLKNGSGAPLAGDLVAGEPALDLTNKRLYTEDSGGTVIEVGTNPTSLTTGTFTSTGIDDNATSTAITISSGNDVGLGRSPTAQAGFTILDVGTATTSGLIDLRQNGTRQTRIYNSSSDTYFRNAGGDIYLQPDEATAMVLKDGGNVGIGTTAPSRLLHLKAADSCLLQLQVGNTTGNCQLLFGDSGSTTIGKILYNHTGNVMSFETNSSEQMRIDSSGNVGIGTTSPNALLHVSSSGNGEIEVERVGGALINLQAQAGVGVIGTDSNHGLRLKTNGTVQATITASGDVGIGTTSPDGTLHVKDAIAQVYIQSNDGQPSQVVFGDVTDASGGMIEYTSSNEMAFKTNNLNERMRIDSSGNLLVGTTTASKTTGAGYKYIDSASAPEVGLVGTTTSGSGLWSVYSTGAAAYRFYVTYAGTIHATSTSITAISDASLKENVRDLDKGLDTINALQPRRFDWKNGDGNDIMGFIAQEVEEVMPELVHEYKYSDEENKKGLKMGDMVPSMVKAIQELSAQVNELKAEVAALKGA